jgi:hypothetical protein
MTGLRYQPIGDRDGRDPFPEARGPQDDGKVPCLGPDRADLIQVATVALMGGSEIVIHAMWMRRIY